MNPTSRRDFLKTAPWLPLGAAALGFGTVSAPALEPVRRTGGPALKVSCNLFCFNQLLLDHLADPAKGIGLLELLDFCAKQNFDGVDVTGYYFPGYQPDGLGVPTDKFIYDLKRRALRRELAGEAKSARPGGGEDRAHRSQTAPADRARFRLPRLSAHRDPARGPGSVRSV